ncbi:MAG: Zn-ribbon domain-containing OB-fold protein, partial [Pseudomonadota bacterium]
MGVKCKACGTKYFPPQVDCPKCVSSETEWFEIKGKGKLVSYSIMNYGPSGFEDKAPYALAVGEFEGGVKVFGTLDRDIKAEDIKIGMPLKVAALKLAGDKVSFELKATR